MAKKSVNQSESPKDCRAQIAELVRRPVLRLIDLEKQRRDKGQRKTEAVCSTMHSRSRRGEVRGMALYFRDHHGEDHCVFTGLYEDNLAEAANAAARMAWFVNERQDDLL